MTSYDIRGGADKFSNTQDRTGGAAAAGGIAVQDASRDAVVSGRFHAVPLDIIAVQKEHTLSTVIIRSGNRYALRARSSDDNFKREMRHRKCDQIDLGNSDVEGASWDMVLAPLDDEQVLAGLLGRVRHGVPSVSHVLHVDLLAWRFRAVDPDQQHVAPCGHKNSLFCRKDFSRRSLHDGQTSGVSAPLGRR